MITIVNFHPRLFNSMVDCYQFGFPDGHNRYTLARLTRFQRETIFLVVDHDQNVYGVLIGITSAREAWFTGLTLLPDTKHPQQYIAQLAASLSHRFVELGFVDAKLTTARKSILRFTQCVGTDNIEEVPNCYYDGETRWVITVNQTSLPRLIHLAG